MRSKFEFDFSVFAKRWKVIALVTIVFILLGYCYSSFIAKPTYRCDRSYMVSNNISYTNDVQSRQATLNDTSVSRLLVTTYKDLLSRNEVMKDLADHMPPINGRQLSYQELQSLISVTAGETEILRITVITGEQKSSRLISDTIDEYLVPLIRSEIGLAEIKLVGTLVENTSKPNVITSVLLMAFAGLFFGFLLALLLHLTNNTIADEDEFEKKYTIPVLGVIPDAALNSKGAYKYGK